VRVKFVISYDGRAYRGSQTQPHVRTVQETLETGLQKIRAYVGRTTFAGRTDAGVHAVGQVVSCDVDWDRELHRLTHALNSVMPKDLRVISCDEAAPGFSARFDAVSREYRYRIVEAIRLSPLHSGYIWAYPEAIDPDLATLSAGAMRGLRNFGSFASAGVSRSFNAADLERNVVMCDWRTIGAAMFPVPGNRPVQELRIRADGFLPQMVRNIMSAIVEVASGNKPQEWIEYLLVSGDRRLLGPPAPPHGLVLWNVEYDGNLDSQSGNQG
jgi:tRNA pseudouridine38-40 synthase